MTIATTTIDRFSQKYSQCISVSNFTDQMATLDEKYLDGPNVGYCSDSDEEPEPSTPAYPTNPPGSGKAGAKGVLEDYRASKEASKLAALQAEKNVGFCKKVLNTLLLFSW